MAVNLYTEINKILQLSAHKDLQNDDQCIEIINDLRDASDIKFGASSVVLIYPNFVIRLIKKTWDKPLPDSIDSLISIPSKELICSSIFYNIYTEEFVENLYKLNIEDFLTIKQFVVNMMYKGYLVIDINFLNFLKGKNGRVYFVDYEGIFRLTAQCDFGLVILFVYNLYNLKQFCRGNNEFIPYNFTYSNIDHIIQFVNLNSNNLMQNFFDAMIHFNKKKFAELVLDYS
jgi:hypothetical protein